MPILQDSVPAFIRTDQGEVLTWRSVVSAVTIRPVTLASSWGMNFTRTPAQNGSCGHSTVLAVLVVSIAAPPLGFGLHDRLSRG